MKPIKKVFARQLRSDQTDTEKLAWGQLRDRRCYGLKFRRQHVIEGFVVDFYCDEIALAIEVDGRIHERRREYDQARDEVICSEGVSIIRIENEAVAKSRNLINKKVKSFLVKNNISFDNPSPSLSAEVRRTKEDGRGSKDLQKMSEGDLPSAKNPSPVPHPSYAKAKTPLPEGEGLRFGKDEVRGVKR